MLEIGTKTNNDNTKDMISDTGGKTGSSLTHVRYPIELLYEC